jgi:hypothetical protein
VRCQPLQLPMRRLRPLLVLVLLAACDDASSDPPVVGRDAGEAGVCRLNSDCPPGLYCKDRVCTFDCRVSRDCPPGELCESGQCLPPSCERDTDCDPPATVCENLQCLPGCTTSGCPEGQGCGPGGRCSVGDCRRDGCAVGLCDPETGMCSEGCVPACGEGQRCEDGRCVVAGCVDTGCPGDDVCDPDTGLCQAPDFDCRQDGCPNTLECDVETGQCEQPLFDCRRDGCGGGQVCEAMTGRCVPFDCRRDGCVGGQICNEVDGMCGDLVGNVPLGEACNRGFECESNVCLGGRAPGFCSKVCCAETDCPAGMGCLYQGGVSLCIPAVRVANNDFSAGVGSACGAAFNNCRTGLCLEGRCAGSCCTDLDCPGACVWTPTDGGEARAICDAPNILGGPAGSVCFGDLDCENRVCVADPTAPGQGYCAGWCCTNADCPAALRCGQVQGPGHIITACVPLPTGGVLDGAACLQDADCQSGHCIENVCRQPCCRDQDRASACLLGERCLLRTNLEGSFIRVCVPPDLPPP